MTREQIMEILLADRCSTTEAKKYLNENRVIIYDNKDEFLEELNQFKTNVETKEKEAIIAKYALRLDEEKIEAYSKRIAEFTISDLEKELALELVAHDPSIFSAQGSQNGFIPKSDEYEEGSLEALLSKYQKK